MRRALDRATIALFLLALGAPALDQCLRPDEARDCRVAEQRRPAPRPALPGDLAELGAFPNAFERHYMDTFGLRDVLLRWNSVERWLGLGVLPSKQFEAGRGGWCFYLGDDSRRVHRGLAPFSAADLDGWVRRLRERTDALARRGVRYLFVLCPSKETIYPELAPPTWTPLGPSRLEQLAERCAREPDLPFLDLRAALLAAKAGEEPGHQVFTPLGTHWNAHGTYAAYRAILERLRQDFPDLPVLSRAECTEVENDGREDGLSSQLYIDDLLSYPVYSMRPAAGQGFEEVVRATSRAEGSRTITRKDIQAPRLLWLHDSFGPYLYPLVCESFAYVQAYWTHEFMVEAIDEARPDVVLETYVERVLAVQPPYQPTSPKSSELDDQFEGLADVLWRAAADGSFPPAQSLGGAVVERREGALHLQRTGTRDGLLLPPLSSGPDTAVLLRLRARCEAPLDVDAFVRVAGAPSFQAKNGATLQLGPGRPVAVARLPYVGSPFEVVLRPRPPASEVDILELEVRRGSAAGR